VEFKIYIYENEEDLERNMCYTGSRVEKTFCYIRYNERAQRGIRLITKGSWLSDRASRKVAG